VERPKPSSGAQSPLAAVPEDHPPELVGEALPGGYFITNPDETQNQPPDPDPPAQAESTSLSGFGNSLGGSMGQNLFGAVTSGFGWGKSKPTTPKTSTPAWGGLGSVVPSVTESTGGGGGWGAATGNNNGSNSMWGSILGGKSGNASAADLLEATDPSAQDAVQNGESLSFIPLDGPPAEAITQEGHLWQDGPGSQEPLTVETNVTAEPGADTAGPTTAAADSPEVETREGDGGGQGGEEEKPEDDEWAIPVKTKKKKGSGAATPMPKAGGASAGAGEDDWATTGGKKKKGKKR
jgi:hypothetical protein